MLALASCRATLPAGPTTQPALDALGNADLMEYLADQPYVTAEAAGRAVYILARNEAFSGGFDQLCTTLRKEGIIPLNWRPTADELVRRADVGFMVCRAAGIRSGVNWLLTGLGRYAWRELQYRRIAGPGSELRLISGGEFVGVIARAAEQMPPPAEEAATIPLGAPP